MVQEDIRQREYACVYNNIIYKPCDINIVVIYKNDDYIVYWPQP